MNRDGGTPKCKQGVRLVVRRRGLTSDERKCMSRLPAPSSACLEKLSCLKSDDPGNVGFTCFPLSPARKQIPMMKYQTRAVLPDMTDASPEEQCMQILQKLLPLPELQRPETTTCAQELLPLQQRSSVNSSSASRDSTRGPSVPAAMLGNLLPIDECFQGNTVEDKGLVLLLKDGRQWNPKSFPLVENRIRLVRSATATRLEKDVGGKVVFVFDDPNEAAGRRLTMIPGRSEKPAPSRIQVSDHHPLQYFRTQLLDKFVTMEDAFETIFQRLTVHQDEASYLELQEFYIRVQAHGLRAASQGRIIYELLDVNKDGRLSLYELNVGVQCTAPVSCAYSLRRRLLCLGFPSMRAALSAMHGPTPEDTTNCPLPFQSFSEALSRAYILEPNEHRAIFDLVRDKNDPQGLCSLSELFCGLASVSPSLLFEDVRVLCQSKFGSIDAAVTAWTGVSQGNVWDMVATTLGLSCEESTKLASFFDANGSTDAIIRDLRSMLILTTPMVTLEDSRKQLQLCFRSIELALQNIFSEAPKFLLDSQLVFTCEELVELLQDFAGVEPSITRIIKFMFKHSEGLSLACFLKWARLLVPCQALEVVRRQLGEKYSHPADAFKKVTDRQIFLSKAAFASTLEKAGVVITEEELQDVFQLVDIRHSGVVTVTEFIAALQCSHVAGRVWLTESERARQVQDMIRQELAPLRCNLSEFRQRLKRGLKQPSFVVPGGRDGEGSDPRAISKTGFRVKNASQLQRVSSMPSKLGSVNDSPSSTERVPSRALNKKASLPCLSSDRKVDRLPIARKTFQKITSSLSHIPASTELIAITEDIGGYFVSSEQLLNPHSALLSHPLSGQVENHRLVRKIQSRVGAE